MIAPEICRCDCCSCFATRVVLDEYGERVVLCDRCPSPDEIRQRAAEVRSLWDDVDYWCRQRGLSREAAYVWLGAKRCDVHSLDPTDAPPPVVDKPERSPLLLALRA